MSEQRFYGVRVVRATPAAVWAGLHDPEVLVRCLPGCERLAPAGAGRYDARLAARVGPIADSYRGSFVILDERPGEELRVVVEGRGRCGRLELDLHVSLAATDAGTTALTYDATAEVRGIVARVGGATLEVVGGHLTGCFFRDLDRCVTRPGGRRVRVPAQAARVPA